MSAVTDRLSEYVRRKRINIAAMSRDTGIPYMAIYDSLMNEKRDRDLKDNEFLSICKFLEVNPMNFADTSEPGKEMV